MKRDHIPTCKIFDQHPALLRPHILDTATGCEHLIFVVTLNFLPTKSDNRSGQGEI